LESRAGVVSMWISSQKHTKTKPKIENTKVPCQKFAIAFKNKLRD
jgi:hypothetical protein